MNHTLKLLLTASALSVLVACGSNTSSSATETANKSSDLTAVGSAAAIAQTLTVDAFRPTPATVAAQEPPVKARDLAAAPTPTIVALGAPPASQTTAAQKSTAEDHMGKPMQIGFGRDVAQTASVSATNQILKWQATKSGGQVAAINFSSAGAKGLRVGLLITQLPETAILRFYAKGDATAFEVKGSVVLAVIAKNLAAGDTTNDARTYWSPVLKANNGTVEIEIPAGVDTCLVQTSVPIVSHLFMSMSEAQAITAQDTYSGGSNTSTLACQVNVKCTSPLPAASDAVAWLVFNRTVGGAYICSGTLLNDNLNSGTPYILTANHCISTQTFASTLYTEFKYRALTCGTTEAETGEYFPTATTGSTLLYTAYGTDSTLLQLYGTPSTTVLFAGWDATTPPATSTTGIHSIHHPKGDQQRLSRGTITGYSVRSPTNPNSFIGSNITSGTILDVTLNIGLTEGGSSGSGLFKGTDANPILIGQLFGGYTPGNYNPNNPNDPNNYTPACATANPLIAMPPDNVYGRFDVAFNAGMKDFLVKGIKSVTQLYNATSKVYFYTYYTTEISNASTSNPPYSGPVASFNVSSYQTAGLSPVYRFYNTSNGSYFYTISEKERAAVASNTPRMRYDGVVWYASATSAGTNTQAVYSYFNSVTGSQFFTTSNTATGTLIAGNSQFKADGIAFYVTP